MSRHVRQSSNGVSQGPVRIAVKDTSMKGASTRQALSEVTMAAVNRKVRPSSPNFLSEVDVTRIR
jgi:hypothetical protein